ncbi:winged helix-turn-helix transcriptional regulator [Mycobacterium sp. 050134]|uniref:winged helix-turn-helix transcriptional regulator n=1 Tax=Mycobacterium sp. 050134 TaxID=3096111 RepID=UPI002ED9557B
MALRSDWSEDACPVARSLDILGDPWNILILRDVFAGNSRYETLRDSLNVADAVLSKRLAQLVDAGLLRREPYAGTTRPRYDYTLTKSGRDTLPILHAMARWGDAHLPRTPKMLMYCTRCGKRARSSDWCPTCARPLTVQSTAWRRPAATDEVIDLSGPSTVRR